MQATLQLDPFETGIVRQLVTALVTAQKPGRALCDLARRHNAPDAEVFERYAATLLHESGVEHLANTPLVDSLSLEGPGYGNLAHLSAKSGLSLALHGLLLDVEDALGRIMAIADAVEDAALNAAQADATAMRITFMGVDRRPKTPSYRSALVDLPQIGSSSRPSMVFYNELDWRILDNVSSIGHTVFQSCIRPNARQAVLQAKAPNGSDWDVRTRLATILDGLELPLHFAYRFDCDVERRTATVAFSVPPASSLPKVPFASELPQSPNCSNALVPAAHESYILRLMCLVACACFGSGRHIEHAYLLAETEGGQLVAECAFDRDAFVRTVLVSVDDKSLSDRSLRFNPRRLAELMSPRWLSFRVDIAQDAGLRARRSTSASGKSQDSFQPSKSLEPLDIPEHTSRIAGVLLGARPIDFDEAPARISVADDARKLDDSLVRLFGALRIKDLDTRRYFGENANLIEEARSSSRETILAAIAQLETVVARLENEVHPFDDNASARPLYCGNPLSRIAVALLADELAIGNQAQAFLDGNYFEDVPVGDRRHKRPATFFRVPNALFDAHMGLADLYLRLGDFGGAASHADYCMSLAPTTVATYLLKADILGQQHRYAQAANVLIAGLNCAISKRDCSLLYYHLGLLYWRMDKKEDAVALQVYASSLHGEFADKAREAVANLRKQPDVPVIVHASPQAAVRQLMRSRIPIAPTNEARNLIASAAIGLSCANAPLAAAPYAEALVAYLPSDRILEATFKSLRHGIRT